LKLYRSNCILDTVSRYNNNNNNNNNNKAIPSDKNVIQKEAENKLKYKNLSIEIQRMWNMKCFVIPVIIGATGIVSKSLQKYLETIPGQLLVYSLQKPVILGTLHIIRKVLHWFKWSSTREKKTCDKRTK
jgi:hypothetical protein